jgi:hypothetical protein
MSVRRPEVELLPEALPDQNEASVAEPTQDPHMELTDGLAAMFEASSSEPAPSSWAEPTAKATPERPASRRYMVLFERVTGIIGIMCLIAGLALWAFRSGDHRLALVVLVCAMFLAILHYYSLEDTRNGHARDKH